MQEWPTQLFLGVALGQVIGIDRLAHLFGFGQYDLLVLASSALSRVIVCVHESHHRQRGAAQEEGGKQYNDEGRRDNHVPLLLTEAERVQRQTVTDSSSQSTEPHDKHHALADLVFSEIIAQVAERVDVHRSTKQAENDRPNYKRWLNSQLKAE